MRALRLLSIAALMASSAGQADAKDKITIGMVNLFNQAAYFTGMDTAVRQEAAAFDNVEVISTDAGFDIAKLASDIDDLLSKHVDGLIISAGPTETLPASLAAIQAAGIPVVFVDRLWKNTNLTTPWNWVGAQNTLMGQEIGAYINKTLGGKGDVLVIRGGPADNSIGIDRTTGFTKALEGGTFNVVVAPGFGNWGNDGGYKVMADILAKMPKIDAVFCENDSMCLGAQKAAQAANRNEMVFAASDAGKETLHEMLRNGTNFVATAVNDSDQIGRTGFHHLMAMMAGAKIAKLTPLPSPLVLKDDAYKRYDPSKVF